MNSLKSLCSFAKSTPVLFDQLEENLESGLGCQVRVELIVSAIGFFETAENLDDSFHRPKCITRGPPSRCRSPLAPRS